MKIVTIVVTYNAGKWIEKCLGSLLNSSTKTEIIVVDNQSTDNTLQLITESFKNVRLIRNTENAGFGKANNIGILKAFHENADYIFLLNQDARVEPETIGILVDKLSKNTRFGIVSPLQFFDTKTLDKKFESYLKNSRAKDYQLLTATEKEQLYPVQFANAAVWLMSRSCIETVGLFAPVFSHYGEDLNYAHRCKFHQVKIGVSPAAIAYHERPQKPSADKLLPVPKLLERDKNYCLGVLLNLKHSFFRQWLFLLFTSLKNLIPAVFRFRFKTAYVILNRFKMIFKIQELSQIRKELKNRGAFLND